MAKRRGRPPGSGKVTRAAQTVGGALGSLVSRAEAWLHQRDQLVAELRAMADNIASGGKAVVGSALQVTGVVGRAGSKAIGRVTGAAKKRPTMSAEARAKIAAAQRARWAKQKAAEGVQLAVKSAKKAKKR